jgi:uncharacterized MAPEG superfamily protein
MISITIDKDFAYVIIATAMLYLQQNLLFVIPVVMQRKATGIDAPTMYPRDSEIKALKLTDDKVDLYMRAQRVHQNNVEFLAGYLPLLIVAGFLDPLGAAKAAAVVWVGRLLFGIGYLYSKKMRSLGGFFHLGELYTLYVALAGAYNIIVANKGTAGAV